MTLNLVGFLRARLAEDERVAAGLIGAAQFIGREPDFYGVGGPAALEFWQHFTAHRMSKEVEAKRRLIDEVLRYEAKIDGEWGCCCEAQAIGAGECAEISPDDVAALRLLALPYAGHPDYCDDWRPEA